MVLQICGTVYLPTLPVRSVSRACGDATEERRRRGFDLVQDPLAVQQPRRLVREHLLRHVDSRALALLELLDAFAREVREQAKEAPHLAEAENAFEKCSED